MRAASLAALAAFTLAFAPPARSADAPPPELVSVLSRTAIVVADLERSKRFYTYARLRELGARILLEPMRSADGTQTELVVHDPDGIRIHVVQRAD